MKGIIDKAFDQHKGKMIKIYNKNIQDVHAQEIINKDTDIIIDLSFYRTKITYLFIKKMNKGSWASLLFLNLNNNHIGNKGLKYLSQINLPKLNSLQLQQNQISTLGISHLIKSQWKQLSKIHFKDNQIGFDAIKLLSSAKWVKTIKQITLTSTNIYVDQMYKIILTKANLLSEKLFFQYQIFFINKHCNQHQHPQIIKLIKILKQTKNIRLIM